MSLGLCAVAVHTRLEVGDETAPPRLALWVGIRGERGRVPEACHLRRVLADSSEPAAERLAWDHCDSDIQRGHVEALARRGEDDKPLTQTGDAAEAIGIVVVGRWRTCPHCRLVVALLADQRQHRGEWVCLWLQRQLSPHLV